MCITITLSTLQFSVPITLPALSKKISCSPLCIFVPFLEVSLNRLTHKASLGSSAKAQLR